MKNKSKYAFTFAEGATHVEMPKNKLKSAFTLAEVVIVMLIIAVIVAISIKIAKTKLNSITSYTYYSAYKTVNSVSREMLKDFDAEEEDYSVALQNNNLIGKWKYFFASNFGTLPVFATDCTKQYGPDKYGNYTYVPCTFDSEQDAFATNTCNWATGQHTDGPVGPEASVPNCPSGTEPDYKTCQCVPLKDLGPLSCVWQVSVISNPITGNMQALCPFGTTANYDTCRCEEKSDPTPDPDPPVPPNPGNTCPDVIPCGQECNASTGYVVKDIPGFSRTCPNVNEQWNESSCGCKPIFDPDPDPEPEPEPEPEPGNTCPDVIPCGQECNASTGFVVRDIAGFSRTCDDRYKIWNEASCGCVPTPPTVPRRGLGFCKLFVSYANTSKLAEDAECHGIAIGADQTDFNPTGADIILRNGMILYNVSQDPEPIAVLSGNSKGKIYNKADGTPVDIDEWGYTLYIDIDGERSGKGKLWEDVYPFYVTLSGTVIPAYDMDNPETAGGDSKLHLQTSVHDEYVDNTGRHDEWITKSRTFKDSACTMGYINPATDYCSGVAANAQCDQQDHDCRLKTVMPVKFFGH